MRPPNKHSVHVNIVLTVDFISLLAKIGCIHAISIYEIVG